MDYAGRREEQSAECVCVCSGGGGDSKKTNRAEVSEVDSLMGTHTSSGSFSSFGLVVKPPLYKFILYIYVFIYYFKS